MIGKSLVHYEISAQIGRGGMGEVYQAKDTKLGRDVAIKVLPEEFALDTDRVARFQREAKLLASLNHPNIAAIHGLEESEGIHFLVMELIEGETLKDRIKSGPIPVEEALKLALQMAEALEAAHEKGVIHRDLKPANIKVTPDGKVKILDFGLAKAYAGDQENLSPMDSPTISAAATQQGVILGTAAYMSPEQARGKPVDRRADIWAFGVVLYEMLTGKAAFSGDDVTDTLAAVIRSEPEWKSLPTNLHWRLKELLERCLEKVARDRYGSIGDARVDIRKVLADPSGVFIQPITTVRPRRKMQVGVSWLTAAIVLSLFIAGVAVWYLKPPEPRKVMRFSYELPETQQFTSDIELAVSPDGSQFVYCTTDGLYLRSVDALDARLIAGTDQNSAQPVFSPDGRWIAYWSSNDRKLKKIAISGGVPVVLCDTSLLVIGLSWSLENTILYSDALGGGVKRVSADGGTPEFLIEAELANLATDGIPIYPQMLSDGKTLLFTNSFSATDMSNRQITIQSLESGERQVLVDGTGAKYLSTEHVVYLQVSNNTASIVAVPFDFDTMEVMGGPVPLLEGVIGSAVSDSGTLLYVPGTSGSTFLRTLVWVDRGGKEEPLSAKPNVYSFPRISPDGTRVVLAVEDGGNEDIWIWDLVRKTMTRLTFHESLDSAPLWTPDGQRIAFTSTRDGSNRVYWKAADGTGEVMQLGIETGILIIPSSWSADGKTLVLEALLAGASENVDIASLSMEGDHAVEAILKGDFIEANPQVSPNGQWLAYLSMESGQSEVYVRPFPAVNSGKWQVSTSGGQEPRWSPDGRELFYRSGDAMMTVAIETEPTFKAGVPEMLFRGGYFSEYGHQWDISPDGERFLMIKHRADDTSTEEASRQRINIVLNWSEELKQRVPVD